MNLQSIRKASAFVAALGAMMLCSCLGAFAAEYQTVFAAAPGVQTAKTGEDVVYTVSYTEGNIDVAGVMITLQIPDGWAFGNAAAAGDRARSEISYSVDGSTLRLLFTDNGAGQEPARPGDAIAAVTLVPGKASENVAPSVVDVDVCGIEDGKPITVPGTASVGGLTVAGATSPVQTPTPGQIVYSNEGAASQTVPVPTKTPAPTPRPVPSTTPVSGQPANVPVASETNAGENQPTENAPAESSGSTTPVPQKEAAAEAVTEETAELPSYGETVEKTSSPKANPVPVLIAVVAAVLCGGGVFLLKKKGK